MNTWSEERERASRIELELPVVGIPAQFVTNDPRVAEAVREAFGEWEGLEARPELVSDVGITVRVFVHSEAGRGEGAVRPIPLTHRLPDSERDRLILFSGASVATADVRRRDACGYVSEELVSDGAQFRYALLEALTLFLVTRLDRQPLHAAGLVREGAAVLLFGPSGVGKSTVVMAALREGFRLLAEDMVFLQTRPVQRIWGRGGSVYLPPEALRFFPGSGGEGPAVLANGKRKVAVRVPPEVALRPPVVDRGTICLLERGERAALVPVGAQEIERVLTTALEPGFDLFRATIAEAVRPLVRGGVSAGGFRLLLAGDPAEAVPLLTEALRASGG